MRHGATLLTDLTAETLKARLDYDPATGDFRWLAPASNRVAAGDIAGSVKTNGYRSIGIDGTLYLAHRLAWLYMTGSWPAGEIDHRNGIRLDNRFANLRPGSRHEQMQNQRSAMSTSKSGILGVSYEPHRRAWVASIYLNGRHITPGRFPTAAQAEAAYLAAKRNLHPFWVTGCAATNESKDSS